MDKATEQIIVEPTPSTQLQLIWTDGKGSYFKNILCMTDILEHYCSVACDAIRCGITNTDPASGSMSALATPAASMFQKKYRLLKLYSIIN